MQLDYLRTEIWRDPWLPRLGSLCLDTPTRISSLAQQLVLIAILCACQHDRVGHSPYFSSSATPSVLSTLLRLNAAVLKCLYHWPLFLFSPCQQESMLAEDLAYGHILASPPHHVGAPLLFQLATVSTIHTRRPIGILITALSTGL